MAKKNKNNKKAALSMRAAGTGTNTTELTPPLSPSRSKDFSEDTPLPFDLPSSPVANAILSLHASPTLPVPSNNPLSPDFNPFLIPPPAYHLDPQQDPVQQDDWAFADPQPLKRKSKKAKRHQAILQLPEDSTDFENSEAPVSDYHTETQSETETHSETEKEVDVEASGSVHTILEEPEPEPDPEPETEVEPEHHPESEPETEVESEHHIELEPEAQSDPQPETEPNPKSELEPELKAEPVPETKPDPELEVSILKPEVDTQSAISSKTDPHEIAKSTEFGPGNEIVTREPEQVSPIGPIEDSGGFPKPLPNHPPHSGYWPSPYYGQYHPHPPRNMAYQPPFPYGMSPPRNGSPYQSPYGGYPGPYPPYMNGSPMQRHDSFGSTRSNAGDHGPMPSDTASAVDEDPADLLNRVSSILPDIHMLIDRHKSTHGELSLREQLIRKEKAESAEAARNKDDYINRLIKQLHEAEQNNAAEASKFRLHVANLEDKRKEMEEKLVDAELTRKAVQAMNKQLEEEKASLIEDKLTMAKLAAEEKDRVVKEFEDCKVKAEQLLEAEKQRTAEEKVRLLRDLEDLRTAALEAQKLALGKEHDQELKDQRQHFDEQKAKLVEEFAKEKDEFRSTFQSQKKEIEASFETLRKDLEGKLNSTQANLEQVIKTEREGREQWSAERETLTKGWEQERDSHHKEVDEQRQALIKQHEDDMAALARKHKDDINEQTLGFVSLQEGINKKMTAENEGLREQLESLKKAWEQDKEKFESVVKELSGVAQALDTEKGRLQRLVEGFGEITDSKSKGDTYYVNSFSQLSKHILDLTATHFVHLPIIPRAEILARIPSTLPSILEDSPSSRHLRASYIAHTISSILTTRIFTPFLFSLGRRFDQADDLFTNISDQLRSKSTRREAIWRQHTLTACYTTTDAKQRINSAAGEVIEEIVKSIMPFTEPSAENEIRPAIRRIVKLAVEVWRFARLEREMIEASMPETFDEESAEEGFWLPQNFDHSAYPVNAVKPMFENSHGANQLLLRVFPIIRREPIHQCFRLTEKEADDQGCVYNRGIALYHDSPPVLARRAELRRSSGSLSPLDNNAAFIVGVPQEVAVPRLQPTLIDLPPINTPAPLPESAWPPPSPGPILPPKQRRSKSPPSPLFPAVGEIDGLDDRHQHPQSPKSSRSNTSHNHRPLSASASWHSTDGESIKERQVVEVGRSRYEDRNGYSPVNNGRRGGIVPLGRAY